MSVQHFVPQHYFRLYSGSERLIDLLLLKTGEIKLNCKIRQQCSKRDFYGSDDIERVFSHFEATFSQATRSALEFALDPTEGISDEWWIPFCQSITFQRGRTESASERTATTWEQMALWDYEHSFLPSLDATFSEQAREALKKGAISFVQSRKETASFGAILGLEMAFAISDLLPCFLINKTASPFVFSDSPIVLYNTSFSHVRNRGVLGWQSQGLQVFYPLTPSVCLMLYDADAYFGDATETNRLEVCIDHDVFQLNMLQLHAARNAVYFSGSENSEYVASLWEKSSERTLPPGSFVDTESKWLVDGKLIDGPQLLIKDAQLAHQLELSFICSTPVLERDFVPRNRNRWVADVVNANTEWLCNFPTDGEEE
jgi:hypothetical protein